MGNTAGSIAAAKVTIAATGVAISGAKATGAAAIVVGGGTALELLQSVLLVMSYLTCCTDDKSVQNDKNKMYLHGYI